MEAVASATKFKLGIRKLSLLCVQRSANHKKNLQEINSKFDLVIFEKYVMISFNILQLFYEEFEKQF